MQTQNLQMPTLNANAAAAPRVNLNLQASGGDNAFQRALSREMDQRQSSNALTGNAAKASERPSQSRAIARANETAKPATPASNATAANSNASSSAASTEAVASGNPDTAAVSNPTGSASSQDSAAAASTAVDQAASDAASDAQAAAQADPVAQMLALVAAFNQPISLAPATPASVETDQSGAATTALLDTTQSAPEVLASAGSAADAATLPGSSDPASVASAAQALQLDSDAASSSASSSAASFSAALMQAQSGAAANAASSTAAATAAAAAGTAATSAAATSALQASAAQTSATPDASDTLASADASDALPELVPASVDTSEQAGNSAPIKAGPASVSSQPAAEAGSSKTETLAAAFSARTGNPSESVAQLKEAAPAISVASNAQSALAAAKAAVSAVPTDKLSSRVGTPAWDQQLGQKIIFMAAGGEQSATMELNPPDLGPLQVVLSINKDQATAAFSSAQPEVRQALEAALPKLKEMMSEAGIQLGNASVSAGMSDQGNAFQQQASAAQSGSGRSASGGNAGSGGSGRESNASAADTVRSAAPRRLPAGAVDTFA
jgi:flagellar hook-length control protein FliK